LDVIRVDQLEVFQPDLGGTMQDLLCRFFDCRSFALTGGDRLSRGKQRLIENRRDCALGRTQAAIARTDG
jgi:hypothetical protein